MRARASKKRMILRTFEPGPFLSETAFYTDLLVARPDRLFARAVPREASGILRQPPLAPFLDLLGRRLIFVIIAGSVVLVWKVVEEPAGHGREGHPETEGFRGVEAFRRRGGPSTRVGLARYLRILEPPGRCDRDTTALNPRSFVRLRCARVSREVRAPATAVGSSHPRKSVQKKARKRGESSSFRFADQKI